jgi:hypothetical protein
MNKKELNKHVHYWNRIDKIISFGNTLPFLSVDTLNHSHPLFQSSSEHVFNF